MHFLDDDLELVADLPEVFQDHINEVKLIEQQAENVSSNVKEAKKRLFAEYANLTKSQIEERSEAIREDYKLMRNLYNRKCRLSSDLEQMMDRVNNKIKRDTDNFRFELEIENPGVTFEIEKEFTEECDKAFYYDRNAEDRLSARETQLMYNGQQSQQRQATRGVGRPEKHGNRKADKSMRIPDLQLHLFGRLLRLQHQLLGFSTPRHTPGPVSPAIRSSHYPSTSNRHQNGAHVPQTAPANIFTTPNFPDAMTGQFDPTSTNMPSFAGGQESRHGRPRKLTTRVKQMLNEQKVHRSSQHNVFGGVATNSPLSNQGFSLTGPQSQSGGRAGSSSRRQSTSIPRQPKLKRSSVALDEEDSRGSREYGSETAGEFNEYEMGPATLNDEDENLWCLCQAKSYGNMIACDNQQCQYTWFHYDCVGVTEPPSEGQRWYCPVCRNRGIPPNMQPIQFSTRQ
ncbi:Zinc finger and Histone deacetylase superfamily domain containing protein [Aphelenchoides bicaudatus]|nr:Zinc finger and Histone deacetylase superfamily domain containing protein [Aphelenchoides bicaudatus]